MVGGKRERGRSKKNMEEERKRNWAINGEKEGQMTERKMERDKEERETGREI